MSTGNAISDPTSETTGLAQGERRQITAVFMDIVGFSTIASKADPEDLEHWLEEFYGQARSIIEAQGGEVTEYLGDGVVALFGLARADELAASKAVSAAMTALKEVNAGASQGITTQLRIGVATGDAAVRIDRGRENLPRATGMVTTLARRIQQQAAPGTVMISASTQALLRGGIATEEFGNQNLKGFAEAQTLFRPLASQTQIVTSSSSSPFVGRKDVLRQIESSSYPTLLIGQAGIGKSALARHLAHTADAVTTFAADGVKTPSSYQPFTQWLLQQTGSTLPDFTDIAATFPTLDDDAQRALALVLGLPEGQSLLIDRSNVALKGLIEDSLWQAIYATQPKGLLIFEDLHWLDNASFGVLRHILQNAYNHTHQILMTSREDIKIDKHLGQCRLTVIPLAPLSDTEAAEMLDAVADGSTPPDKKAFVISQSAGIPLFIEHLLKRNAFDDNASADVPGSLKDLLADQIDATGPTKAVLQCAAVIGQTFTFDMLEAIASDHAPLTMHLELACQKGVLKQLDDAKWGFAHALLHQAAYDSLLRNKRIAYHAKIAAHLKQDHVDAVMRNPALLTTHLSRAEQHIPAIENYLSVSRWALSQGAFDDAEAHVLAAIALCEKAPADVDVRSHEIACYSALGSILMQTQGFTAASAKKAFETVAKLASRKGSHSSANGPAFYGSFTHAVVSGDKKGATRFADMLRNAADKAQSDGVDSELRLASLNADTALHFNTGHFAKASATFKTLRRHYDITTHGAMITSYGADTFAAAQMIDCITRAICGETHLVSEMIMETDAHQRQLNIPVMQPWVHVWGAVALFYAGHQDAAIDRARRGIAIAIKQGTTFWEVTGVAWLHIIQPSESASEEGLAQFAEAIKTYEMMGAHIGLPYFRAHYALAQAEHGDIAAAYKSSLQAVRENEHDGLHSWYPEVLRLHALVCDIEGCAAGAARFRQEAAAIATQQNAALWLLRTRIDQFGADEIDAAPLAEAVNLLHRRAAPPEKQAALALLSRR
ncbi:MAG: ATP-binding protein [Yoonia sp.]